MLTRCHVMRLGARPRGGNRDVPERAAGLVGVDLERCWCWDGSTRVQYKTRSYSNLHENAGLRETLVKDLGVRI